ncbi:MAG: glycosyltransferase family 4 protein [Anaerolineales bacterium]|nr:glycosyltransferase family 4 protein [Anaerolineales bacterium]
MRAAVKAEADRLRIALPTGIFPPDIGGPASYVPRIADSLVARGHAVEVLTLADDPVGGDYAFPVRRIRRGMPRLARMRETVSAIARSAGGADVIYANGLFIEAAAAAALAHRPLVMKIVGDWAWERASNRRAGDRDMADFQRRRQPLKFELIKLLRSAVSRRADRIIVASRFFHGIVAGWGVDPRRMAIVPNAVVPFPDSPPEELPPFPGRTLAVAARLIPFKRIDGLIRLLALRSDLRLVIVGDGPERGALESLAAEIHVRERVLFTGSVPRAQVGGFLRAVDALVVNSINETFSYSVIEGYAAGVPVVACNGGAVPELIADGENGLLYPPDDLPALSEALTRLFSNPDLRAALIEGGRKAFLDRYQWETLVKRTEDVLMRAAGRSAAAR